MLTSYLLITAEAASPLASPVVPAPEPLVPPPVAAISTPSPRLATTIPDDPSKVARDNVATASLSPAQPTFSPPHSPSAAKPPAPVAETPVAETPVPTDPPELPGSPSPPPAADPNPEGTELAVAPESSSPIPAPEANQPVPPIPTPDSVIPTRTPTRPDRPSFAAAKAPLSRGSPASSPKVEIETSRPAWSPRPEPVPLSPPTAPAQVQLRTASGDADSSPAAAAAPIARSSRLPTAVTSIPGATGGFSPTPAWSPRPERATVSPLLVVEPTDISNPNPDALSTETLSTETLNTETPNPETSSQPEDFPAPEPPSTEQSAETEDELFERIFGQPRPLVQAIAVPWFIDNQPQGQVLVTLSAGVADRVQAAPVLTTTATIVQPELQTQLTTAVDNEGYLPLDALQQVGIVTLFDQSQLQLYLEIPPQLRQTNIVNAPGLPPEAANALSTSRVSGYLNLRGGQDIVWSGDQKNGRQPLRLALDGALNVAGWVLEGSGTWLEQGSPAFSRGDIRVVRDDPTHALRYTVGDISLPVTSPFQGAVPLGGISISRNYALQPYRVTRPTGEYTFFLERPATVEAFVNGVRVQQLRLEAGPQDIRNLPLSTGTNDIQLIITDDVGQVQRLNFSAALAGNLLAPGLQQFSYNLGVPSRTLGGQREYDWHDPLVSLAHRWGVNEVLTLGGAIQAKPDFQLIETDGVWASSVGNFAWGLAASHRRQVGTGAALRLQYEVLSNRTQDLTNRRFRLVAEYRSDRFTTLSTLNPSNASVNLSASYSQRIFGNTAANLSGTYRVGRGVTDTYQVNVGLSRSFGNGLSGNVNLSYGQNFQGREEARAFLGVQWFPGQPRQSVALNTTLTRREGPSTRLSWQQSPARPVQSPGFALDLTERSRSRDLSGRLTYTNYRFDSSLSQEISWPQQGGDTPSNTTRLNFGTALVFADGHFGWSRPVNNSFVLVVPRDRWRGHPIGVNPGSGSYQAIVDGFGPAVLPDLQPYYVSRVELEAPEAPLGYDLGTESYVVVPSYRSGTVIVAGTEASAFVRGVLVDEAGAPIGLQSGEVVSLSDPNWDAQILFTNRVGRFALMGFVPGRYEIRWRDRAPIQFEIAPDQEGLVDVGTLVLPALVPMD